MTPESLVRDWAFLIFLIRASMRSVWRGQESLDRGGRDTYIVEYVERLGLYDDLRFDATGCEDSATDDPRRVSQSCRCQSAHGLLLDGRGHLVSQLSQPEEDLFRLVVAPDRNRNVDITSEPWFCASRSSDAADNGKLETSLFQVRR